MDSKGGLGGICWVRTVIQRHDWLCQGKISGPHIPHSAPRIFKASGIKRRRTPPARLRWKRGYMKGEIPAIILNTSACETPYFLKGCLVEGGAVMWGAERWGGADDDEEGDGKVRKCSAGSSLEVEPLCGRAEPRGSQIPASLRLFLFFSLLLLNVSSHSIKAESNSQIISSSSSCSSQRPHQTPADHFPCIRLILYPLL